MNIRLIELDKIECAAFEVELKGNKTIGYVPLEILQNKLGPSYYEFIVSELQPYLHELEARAA